MADEWHEWIARAAQWSHLAHPTFSQEQSSSSAREKVGLFLRRLETRTGSSVQAFAAIETVYGMGYRWMEKA